MIRSYQARAARNQLLARIERIYVDADVTHLSSEAGPRCGSAIGAGVGDVDVRFAELKVGSVARLERCIRIQARQGYRRNRIKIRALLNPPAPALLIPKLTAVKFVVGFARGPVPRNCEFT